MQQYIAKVALVVRDYDEAIAYYTKVLGFRLVEDTAQSPTKRWVVVAPPGSNATALLLAKAVNPEQESRIGNQTGGRVFLFLYTDDFNRDHARLTANGVKFTDGPRATDYGMVGVFVDLYGNRWDLIQATDIES